MQGYFDFARREAVITFTYNHMKIPPATKCLDTEEEIYRRWQRKNYSKKFPLVTSDS